MAIAALAQGVVGVELTTAARAVLVGMTVELGRYLPAGRTRSGRQTHSSTCRAPAENQHAAWFYDLLGTRVGFSQGRTRCRPLSRLPSSAPAVDEKASNEWRKALASLNRPAKPGERSVPEPLGPPTEAEQTGLPGCSRRSRRRRASGCQRENEPPEAAPRRSVTTANARAFGDSLIGRCGAVAVGVRPQRTRGANARRGHCHRPNRRPELLQWPQGRRVVNGQ